MILRDADTGKVIWQENKDFSSSGTEHKAEIPVKILDLRAVSREINFSTVESLENFRLDQKVWVEYGCDFPIIRNNMHISIVYSFSNGNHF